MTVSALWTRLDTPGHDVAVLSEQAAGWFLSGTTIFKQDSLFACINYCVNLDSSWKTTEGRVSGYLGRKVLDFAIRREADGWYLNEVLIGGLEMLVDLDYSFTPATNFPQMKRLQERLETVPELTVAWFDLDTGTLTALPQTYETVGGASYLYEAPTIPYRALLEVSPTGFINRYPGLWLLEGESSDQ